MSLTADFLSQILGLIRLRGEAVYATDPPAPARRTFAPGSAHVHFIRAGELDATTPDGKQVRASPGDLLVLPQGRGHEISAVAGVPVSLITGVFRFEGDNLPAMLAVLPSLLQVTRAGFGNQAGRAEALMDLMLAEAVDARPGAAIMVSRLLDVLVIEAMRIWVRTARPEDRGWLGALADPRISRALKTIHDDPFSRRTVAELADIAGMSRSSFADRFTSLIGAAPLHYQTRWRLLLANDMLKRVDTRVSDVARRIGYDSDAAFSRAFKAQFGHAPVDAKRPGERVRTKG